MHSHDLIGVVLCGGMPSIFVENAKGEGKSTR